MPFSALTWLDLITEGHREYEIKVLMPSAYIGKSYQDCGRGLGYEIMNPVQTRLK